MNPPAPSWRLHLALLGCATVAWLSIAESARAQRVQFPSTVPGAAPIYPPTPQPSLTPSLTPSPTFDPYATPGLGAPPADIPYAPLGAPGAYAPGSPYAPTLTPPVGAPPAVGIPYQAPSSVPPGGNLFQHLPSVQWNRGTYDYQNPDGSVSRLQRFLQQISLEHTHLFGDHTSDQLQIDRTEMAATFGVPIFYNPDTPLLITPGFAFNWFEGPIPPGGDLPPRTYDAYLDTAWHPQFNDFLGADLGLRTGVWTDFHAVNSDSIRILGRGLGVITLSPKMDLHAGVWYLDRNRIKLLPAGGVHWRPNPEWDAFLVFPNPKIRKRTFSLGSSQWWWYVAGEYGGGRWTVERSIGDDDIDYNDVRLILGMEWETQTRAHGHVEVGYVFDREVLYDSNMPAVYQPDDTVMLRAGIDF